MKCFAALALVAGIVPSQAMAKEIVIHCSGVSRMTIYNPHGNGGTIGGPTSESWTVRTDGHSASLTTEAKETSTAEGRDVQLSSSGLSFCATTDGSPCDAVQTKYDPKGFRHSLRVSRISVSADGTYSSNFSMMSDQAPIKTGVAAEDRGQCDEDGIAELRQLAEADSGDADDASVERDSAKNSGGDEKPAYGDLIFYLQNPVKPFSDDQVGNSLCISNVIKRRAKGWPQHHVDADRIVERLYSTFLQLCRGRGAMPIGLDPPGTNWNGHGQSLAEMRESHDRAASNKNNLAVDGL